MTATVATPTAWHARTYAECDWKVFPIRPRTKRPLVAHGSSEATDDADQVATWWRRWPFANVGALVPAGLVVVDLDPRNGCPLTAEALPATLTVATGGGGWHLYFRAPLLVTLAAHNDVMSGIDLIHAGRQVILPPSIHPNGRRYEWVNDIDPVPLPGRLVDAFERRTVHALAPTHRPHGDGYLDAARRGVVADLRRACVPGNRSNALNAAAFRYNRLGLSVDDAFADLWPVLTSFDRSFTEGDARRTITGAFR